MSSPVQLSATDSLFLATETENNYNHTAGLMVLKPAAGAVFDFETFRDHILERLALLPQFGWRVHEVPAGLDAPYWVADEEPDLARHVKRVAVPAPGDDRALGEVAALLFSRHHDRRHPLWELWYIEGLRGSRVAVMFKLHHGMMDGEGALRLMDVLCDEADGPGVPSPTSGAGHTPSTLEESLRAAQHLLRLPGKTARNVFDTALPKVLRQLTRRNRADKRDGDKLDTHFVPHSMLNADVGRERGYVFTSLRLADVRHIKEHFAVTVNDVLLALAGGALRRYLGRREALPQAPLVATMPVSLRIEGDDELSNKITTVAVSLATDLDNPEQRLRTIHADCERAKRNAHAGGKGVIELLQSLPPLLISALSHSLDAEQAAKLSGTNVIVSNVRASDCKLHLAGARLEALYPMSLISPGLALNITSIGYGGKLDIGITLDPDALRQPWLLVEDLRSELAALLALAGKPSRKRKQAPAGKRKKVPARPRRKSGG